MDKNLETKERVRKKEKETRYINKKSKVDAQMQFAFIWIQSRWYADLKTHKIGICQHWAQSDAFVCTSCSSRPIPAHCTNPYLYIHTNTRARVHLFASLSSIDFDQIQMFPNQSPVQKQWTNKSTRREMNTICMMNSLQETLISDRLSVAKTTRGCCVFSFWFVHCNTWKLLMYGPSYIYLW